MFMANIFSLMRPLIHSVPPETAHNLGLYALSKQWIPSCKYTPAKSLSSNICGLHFPAPIGLAAGFDKNAVAINALLQQGFGFVEAGTVTPKPQAGNPKPRIFRLTEDQAVINRLGFNNNGLEAYVEHFVSRNAQLGIAGANIGKNKDSSDAIADYVTGFKAVYPIADYITVNISSPNTQGLRALQEKQALTDLLAALQQTRSEHQKSDNRNVPLFLKVAPDLTMADREDIAEVVLAHGIDALIVSNTTISRPSDLKSAHHKEQGGLSGKPLLPLANDNMKQFYHLLGDKMPLIGVGGISNADDAYQRIRAGASLVQLYTALVYQGFGVVRQINEGLSRLLARDGYSHISEAIGADCKK